MGGGASMCVLCVLCGGDDVDGGIIVGAFGTDGDDVCVCLWW